MNKKLFQNKIRIYYEDTDILGIVYYANYLKYMERGRTEMLISGGINQQELINKNLFLVVKECNIKYHHPSYFEEILTIITEINKVKNASVEFCQKILNEQGLVVVEAKIVVVSTQRIQNDFKIIQMPEKIMNLLKTYEG